MRELIEAEKNRNFLIFAAVFSVVLAVAIFVISILINNKEKLVNPVAPAIEKKNAFDSLSAPVADSSGKPTSKNYLDSLPTPIPIVSSPPIVKNKKSSSLPASETSKSYINYLPAPTGQ